MKYNELDQENVQDERDIRSFRHTLVYAIIAAVWAIKGQEEGLSICYRVTLLLGVIYLGLEYIRMGLGIKHSHNILDNKYSFIKKNNIESSEEELLRKLAESEVDVSFKKSRFGKLSTKFTYINLFLLITVFIFFIIGSYFEIIKG